ncbi:Beta-lactamase enzyme family protein [Geodermatophilus pulveris]|uniref:Beta-lactamase enzyme family protein n=1 Tax=Geodermatophilus pulveris TaxID=1564159 RepID=A0A239AYL5_9ACTN|nr:serine hydrolase [Geodermatophilus pulveris]SNS00589.1 Beta-lactamase enzyme family protein [Geodermatophilus pulveris]
MRWVRSLVAVVLALAITCSGAGVARADPTRGLVDAGAAEAAARGTTAGIAVLDRATGRYTDNGAKAHQRFGSASLVKLFIADSVLRRASLGEIGLGQADRDALGRMLRSSDDAAASRLWSRFGGSGIVHDVIRRYGLHETRPPANPRYWGLTQVTAHDLVVFYAGMLSGAGGLPAHDRDLVVDQLRRATVHGTDGVHQWFGLRDGLPHERVLGIKQGWMCCFADGYTWRHTTGLVGEDARYVVVVLARDERSRGSAHTTTSSTRIVQRMFPAGLVPRVQGAIGTRWYRMGGHTSRLGLPVGEEIALPGGATSHFRGGAIYWSPGTGAHWVTGAIRRTWEATGAERGRLGYPTSDEITLRGGAGSRFQGGAIYWSPGTGAHWVTGAIRRTWEATGAERGRLGYPTSDEITLRGGAGSRFQGGAIYWSPDTGAHWVTGAIRRTWEATGAERGRLGYPTSDEITLRGGAGSRFQGGAIYWSPDTGAHWVTGAIRRTWEATGAERGRLGYPTSDPRPVAGGTRVDFEHGSLTETSSGRVVTSGTRTAGGTP